MSTPSLFAARYLPWLFTGLFTLILLAFGQPVWAVLALFLFGLGVLDVTQTQQAVRRNYPLTGRLRYALEYIRPEIRQYFLETDEEKIPFSRNQRALVYQRSKIQNDKRGFGSIKDMYVSGAEWIGHSVAPTHPDPTDFRIQIGGSRCAQPYAISVFNISAMSFGSLSANAIMALNRGAKMGGFAHDTGEGSVSPYHREHGGDLIWEIGSGYFGCRTSDGRFDSEKFASQAKSDQVKMIEIKLSQGAKPGHGGVLPAAKVSQEISETRGVPMGQDCVSPASHSEFSTPVELMDFISRLRALSGGKPVGFKLCVGQAWEWFAIAKAMVKTGITPDFIVVDGAEGGTGAAPVEFSDHVGMPLRDGLRLVHNTLVGLNLRDQIKIGASGKVISAFDITRCLALGADWCNSARGFMFALGCIQSRHCHTDHCPTGVATQDPARQRALVVTDKAERVRNFHKNTLANLADLLGAAGLNHPDQVNESHIMLRDSSGMAKPLASVVPHVDAGALLVAEHDHIVLGSLPEPFKTYWPTSRSETFALVG
ncbi:MAG: FMN-binding glutamate synthase family protein [Burkholderiaceae bacterium]|nr:FMN-binding glutamate synthase family protein [Burkholderiaceae bacterium]